MVPEAMDRGLYAQLQNNGVTGFVAATGKSYLCEDTTEDPLYLEGCKGAKSSLTVPLILHDEVIGTFNVESPEPRAFTESDMQFLEIFTRDVAVALNTLELLVAEKATTVAESVEAIHSAVAHAGRRNPQRRRELDGALHRPRARTSSSGCKASSATPATSSR